jgi:ribosomal protein L11 methyltransferase
MNYISVTLRDVQGEKREILISLLSENGFDSFEEKEKELICYINESLFDRTSVEKILSEHGISGEFSIIPDQNWNAEWEKNFEPVVISGICYVRAPFHPPMPEARYEIIIEPKMSFGTAHHETTSLMIETMLSLDFRGLSVLDMGSGTGILAILARKMNASRVMAVDNDEWAYKNAIENCIKNNAKGIDVIMGEARDISGITFDIILANINRNILTAQMPDYSRLLKDKGLLLMSGFYEEDLGVIRNSASANGLNPGPYLIKNNWIAVKFFK